MPEGMSGAHMKAPAEVIAASGIGAHNVPDFEGLGTIPGSAVDLSEVKLPTGVYKPVVSAGASAGPGSVEMESEDLRQAAAAGETAIKKLIETLEMLKERVMQTEETWVGPGGRYFREVFTLRVGRMEQALEELSTYPRELIAYADDYEGIATQANITATSILEVADQATWANVTGGNA